MQFGGKGIAFFGEQTGKKKWLNLSKLEAPECPVVLLSPHLYDVGTAFYFAQEIRSNYLTITIAKIQPMFHSQTSTHPVVVEGLIER